MCRRVSLRPASLFLTLIIAVIINITLSISILISFFFFFLLFFFLLPASLSILSDTTRRYPSVIALGGHAFPRNNATTERREEVEAFIV